MDAWTALTSGLSLLAGIVLGALFCVWWPRRKAITSPHLPARWPLRARGLVNSNEEEVWKWLRSSFHDHLVMAKVPVLRFTMLLEEKRPKGKSPAQAYASALAENAQWLELLQGVYTTFTVCTADGKVVGCVDISGKPAQTRDSYELKETLLSDCGIAYMVLSAFHLPDASSIRALFLGETPVKVQDHEVTRGGDSDFNAELNAFTRQSAKLK